MTENLTVWKADNQRDREGTFIQTGRKGGDGQPGQRGFVARRQLADPTASHSRIHKPGGTAGEQSRPRNPGLQRGEIKPQTSD